MKSTVSNNSCTETKPYPKLMVLRDNPNTIVLFTAPKIGTRLSGDPAQIGRHNTMWLNERYWKDFEGSICLEND